MIEREGRQRVTPAGAAVAGSDSAVGKEWSVRVEKSRKEIDRAVLLQLSLLTSPMLHRC